MIYAIDGTLWDGKSAFRDGDYIDLVALAPKGENRPRRQVGGVLYAPIRDLYTAVRAKFEIRFNSGESPNRWETDTLFPGPEEDAIYATLLRAPFFQTFYQGAGGEETVLRRTCTLPEYCRGPEACEQTLYRAYDRLLEPTLYYPWLRRNLDQLVAGPDWHYLRDGFERSLPVRLQSPNILFSMHDSDAFCNRQSGGPTGKSLSHRLPMLRRHVGRCPKECAPGKEGVVAFKRSDAQEHDQQQRRHQNRIQQGKPLPHHVHENGNDQPCLQQHEHDDQKPSEVSLKVEVVNKIGCGAENKQQSPDLEINADRMLLPLCVCHDCSYQR